jgi:isoleucyl-tRNA synthetase
MDLAREVCSAGHSIRKAAGRRARLPLSSLTVAAPGSSRLLAYADLIADEVNVQQVKLVETVSDLAETVLNVIPAALGPRLGERTQQVIAATRRGEWSRLADGTVEVGGVKLEPGEFELRLRPSDPASSRTLPGEAGIVALDLETTPELEAEGLARDVIRFVQRARREAGLNVTDRIRLRVALPETSAAVVERWKAHIAAQVLATEIEVATIGDGGAPGAWSDDLFTAAGELSDGDKVVAHLARVG